MKLTNKIILITGASQGLGACLAKKVAKEGAKVVLVARSENLLKELQEEIKRDGGEAWYSVCDIRDPAAIKATVDKTTDRFGTIDILVNNAGVWTDEKLEKEEPELRKTALETNTLGHINFIKEVLPIFQKMNSGHVFNVISSSGASDIAAGDNRDWQTYGASKWAMRGFTKALKESLTGSKIKVTGFYPGGFESNLYENAHRSNAHNQPWMMKTEDVADCIVFALTRPEDIQIEELVLTKRM